jgi:diguanylate cyclase (GGDEF)-like protein
VNKSGQQRMLSQRITMFTIEYLKTGYEYAKELAETSLKKMQENHRDLVKEHLDAIENGLPSPLSPEMQSLYFEGDSQVNQQLDTFSRLILEALKQPPTVIDSTQSLKKEFFELAKEPFLSSLNNVVKQYELESLEKVDRLILAQNVVLTVVILTILLEALFVFRPMVARIIEYSNRLQYEASYDHLSGIYNRRAFFMISEKLLNSAQRYQKPCSVVLLDIDKFKPINDTYGHDVGDIVIQGLAKILKSSLREADVLARFGGEEFIIFLPETSLENASIIAEKLRLKVEKHTFTAGEFSLSVTFSGGVAQCDANKSLDASIKIADERLYQAKNNGRNKIL